MTQEEIKEEENIENNIEEEEEEEEDNFPYIPLTKDDVLLVQKYDTTSKIIKYLDHHMSLPIIEFLDKREIYSVGETRDALIKLVSKTKMIDYVIDKTGEKIEQEGDVLKSDEINKLKESLITLEKRKDTILDNFGKSEEKCKPIITMIDVENTLHEMIESQKKGQSTLEENLIRLKELNILSEHIEGLYEHARINYDIGEYRNAADFLFFYKELSQNKKQTYLSLWGKLAAEILDASDLELALSDYDLLKQQACTQQDFMVNENDEKKQKGNKFNSTQSQIINNRVWLIHWALFLFNEFPDANRRIITDLFSDDVARNTIQTACPWVIRYLVVAIITKYRNRKKDVKNLLKILRKQDQYYQDPFTKFLNVLFVDFDFKKSIEYLNQAVIIGSSDFFLYKKIEEFATKARLLIFETYCRIHQRANIDHVKELFQIKTDEDDDKKLNKDIIGLLRHINLDAKIDSTKNQIIVTVNSQTIYQKVIDQTDDHQKRSRVLTTIIQKAKKQG